MNDIVTGVQPEKRGATVTVNGDVRLRLNRAAWLERTLEAGEELDLAELRQWLLPRQYPEALDAAVRLLAVRARSEREIRQRLAERGYMDETIDMALYKLQSNGLQSDEDFAREWARARVRKGLGSRRIVQELRQKGISSALCDRVMSEQSESAQQDAGTELAAKLLRRYDSYEAAIAMNKVMAALQRRGYGYDDAKGAVARALRQLEEE